MNKIFSNEKEQALWLKFKSGDKEALSSIFLSSFDDLNNYGNHICGDEELTKDCIQNLFLKLWNNRANLDNVTSIKPYLLKSLRNHIFNEIHRTATVQQRSQKTLAECEAEISPEESVIEKELNQEWNVLLNLHLDNLQSRQKEALYLKFYVGLSYEKIAEVMKLQVQSVRNLIFNSIQSLRKNIGTTLTYKLTRFFGTLMISQIIF